jgi:hypothetical protein
MYAAPTRDATLGYQFTAPTAPSEGQTSYSALFRRETPPRLYQLETTRSLAARVCILCALASFLATGYVAFRFRASPLVVQRVFFTTLGLGGFFTGVAALLSALPPHPNDPAQRRTLVNQFSTRWPHISDKELANEYSSLIDLSQKTRILSAQFAAFKAELRPFATGYIDPKDSSASDCASLEQEIHEGYAFQKLCEWNSRETLGDFLQREPSNLKAFMAALWTSNVASTFEKRCNEFSSVLANRLPADEIFVRYHPLFRAQLSAALSAQDEDGKQEKVWPLLRYYEGRVFKGLNEELQKALLPQLKRWVYPIWKEEFFPSGAGDSPSSGSLSEPRGKGELIYETLKTLESSSFSFMSDIHLPLLAETAAGGQRPWDNILKHLPPALHQKFWELFAKQCPSTEPSIGNVKRALKAADVEAQKILITLLASSSPYWRTALAQEIKPLLVPAQSVSGNAFRSATRETPPVDPLEGYLSEADKRALIELRKLSPDSQGFNTALEAFLADNCEAS